MTLNATLHLPSAQRLVLLTFAYTLHKILTVKRNIFIIRNAQLVRLFLLLVNVFAPMAHLLNMTAHARLAKCPPTPTPQT
jgi:hypothetical protein